MRRDARTRPWPRLAAGSLWVVTLAFLIVTAAVTIPTVGAEDVAAGALVLALATVGAVVAARVPRNPIGWLFLAVASFAAATSVAYGVMSRSDDVAVLRFGDWLASWTWAPMTLVPLTFVLLVFPTGRPPTPRWRVVVWAAALSVPGFALDLATGPHLGGSEVYGPNAYHLADHPVRVLAVALSSLLPPTIVASLASVVVRFRRSRGVERAQLRLLALGGSLAVTLVITVAVVEALTAGLGEVVANVVVLVAAALIPVAVGGAILRFRLYDIDRIVSRTVAYGATIAVLGAMYAAAVIAVPRMSPVGQDAPVVVAATTLVVAALFRPLVRRVQVVVDRRFDRRRYDAQRTLHAFAAELRTLVDLDGLEDQLREVVARTVQPSQVTLWLRRDA